MKIIIDNKNKKEFNDYFGYLHDDFIKSLSYTLINREIIIEFESFGVVIFKKVEYFLSQDFDNEWSENTDKTVNHCYLLDEETKKKIVSPEYKKEYPNLQIKKENIENSLSVEIFLLNLNTIKIICKSIEFEKNNISEE